LSAAISTLWSMLKYAVKELRVDTDMVLASFASNEGLALEYMSERLKKEKEIVSAAESLRSMLECLRSILENKK